MNAPRFIGVVGGLFLTISSSLAAEVTFEGNVDEAARFRLKGDITPTDVGNVKAALTKAGVTYQRKKIIALDSPGGSYHAGLDLALFFRRQGIATEVRSGESCFSACAIAFLGGTEIPKDPTAPEDNSAIPNQPPDRSIDAGAQLGFHAPYLDIPPTSYTAENVQEAYGLAVFAIARFIKVADHLYVSTAELPRLLVHDDMYMVDTVDAVRFLRVEYTDFTLQVRDLRGFTHSMMLNACINRYFHLQRRSSLPGFASAADARDEFVEGSRLLANGEDKLAFGIRRMKQGTASTWLSFTPIAKTSDGKSFVWCLFNPGHPTTFYKSAGTVAELFKEAQGKNDIFSFSSSGTTMTLGDGGYGRETWMRVLDMVPPDTKLKDVRARIQAYLRDEKVVQPK